TRGELGTRGTADLRDEEAREAAAVMGLVARENLRMRDGFFRNDGAHQLQVIGAIRKYRPEIIISNALMDRHPDHGRAGDLVNDSVFLAGLQKIETRDDSGAPQVPHRPRLLLQLIQDYYIKPDIAVDVTDEWPDKVRSIQAYRSQFHSEEYVSDEPQTYISKPDFLEYIEGRAREYGKYIEAKFAAGYTTRGHRDIYELSSLK